MKIVQLMEVKYIMKIYSERFPLKYLISDHGICLGFDTKKRSFLFLISGKGMLFKIRPAGDTIVEMLDYEIPEIQMALMEERKALIKRKDGK